MERLLSKEILTNYYAVIMRTLCALSAKHQTYNTSIMQKEIAECAKRFAFEFFEIADTNTNSDGKISLEEFLLVCQNYAHLMP